jgi:hypothetical protein
VTLVDAAGQGVNLRRRPLKAPLVPCLPDLPGETRPIRINSNASSFRRLSAQLRIRLPQQLPALRFIPTGGPGTQFIRTTPRLFIQNDVPTAGLRHAPNRAHPLTCEKILTVDSRRIFGTSRRTAVGSARQPALGACYRQGASLRKRLAAVRPRDRPPRLEAL